MHRQVELLSEPDRRFRWRGPGVPAAEFPGKRSGCRRHDVPRDHDPEREPRFVRHPGHPAGLEPGVDRAEYGAKAALVAGGPLIFTFDGSNAFDVALDNISLISGDTETQPPQVPEPATLLTMASGLILGGIGLRRRKR
ncbi:PEP-CTERM sorting domain-containing protein [Hankyongella ginsenosidimutans]|uniref:PEP-CTERM sorting domain-containing protein n=1 Tax=Hankyongella ginsenosidimutans TaxID=1763828 RepID=A0A4D7BUU3_9SPHN|nr:PEP-CTERM sorting domain-containing protein [Hankyongella ginsenosidimutans]